MSAAGSADGQSARYLVGSPFRSLVNHIKYYGSGTLAENAEFYMLKLGITAEEIAAKLSGEGRLYSLDRDPDAVKAASARLAEFPNARVIHRNYSELDAVLAELDIEAVDGILMDLGVSSYQLDEESRGLSYHDDAPLDMRMSQQGMSAYDVVNTYSERELIRIFRDYGEEKFSSRIAKSIINERSNAPIERTVELAEIIKNAIPAATRRTGGHPARRCFQAIRLEVNGELEKLKDTLDDMFYSLSEGGRVSIITFHSLEDRTVKEKFREFTIGCTCPKEFPVCVCGKTPEGKLINKGVSAKQTELDMNNRSRSAKLRTIERLR